MTFKEELLKFTEFIPTVPAQKKYWLVRTKSGELYNTFRECNIVALEHNELSLFELNKLREEYKEDIQFIKKEIKFKINEERARRSFSDDEEEWGIAKSGLVASQICKFVFEMKKGDTVLIPSSNSDIVSFGIVNESYIGTFSVEELRRISTEAILKKRVTWITDLKRIELDPYLYKMFTAHHAINEVGNYADVIERSISDFFVLDNEAHSIINVQNESDIPAADLFNMGSDILKLIDIVAKEYDLGFTSKDFQVTINLNSPGKIDFKSSIKQATVLLGVLLLIIGGGYEDKSGHSLKTEGLFNTVSDIIQRHHENNMQEQLLITYKDSIKVKTPEDLIRLMKQFSENKDVSK